MPDALAAFGSVTARLAAAIFVLAAGASIVGCCGSRVSVDASMRDVAHKLDAPLRSELRGADVGAVIAVFLKVESSSDEYVSRLVEGGLEILSTTGDVLGARGTRDAILRAARNPFVHRMELSRERPGARS